MYAKRNIVVANLSIHLSNASIVSKQMVYHHCYCHYKIPRETPSARA